MLIKKTRSLCPVCNTIIDADIAEEEGKIWLKRNCPEHGSFKNLYWSDPVMYRRFDEFNAVGNGIANPQNTSVTPSSCPTACGLCNNHHSQTLLANIDLTNRCNPRLRFLFCQCTCLRVYLRTVIR